MEGPSLQYRISAFNGVLDHIGKNAPSNYTHVHKLKAVVAPLSGSMAALVQMHATVDPTQTRAYHEKKVITTAAKLSDRSKQAFKDVQVVLTEGLRLIQSRVEEKVSLKPDAFAQELRAVFRNMSPGDRAAALAQMAKTNNGPALAAITEAPAILSGVSQELQKQYRDLIVQIHASAECAEEAALMEAFDGTLAALRVTNDLTSDLNNPGRLAQIDKGVKAAADAENAFNAPPSEPSA